MWLFMSEAEDPPRIFLEEKERTSSAAAGKRPLWSGENSLGAPRPSGVISPREVYKISQSWWGECSPQHSESGCDPGVNRRGDLFLWGTRSLDAHPHGLSDPPPQHSDLCQRSTIIGFGLPGFFEDFG